LAKGQKKFEPNYNIYQIDEDNKNVSPVGNVTNSSNNPNPYDTNPSIDDAETVDDEFSSTIYSSEWIEKGKLEHDMMPTIHLLDMQYPNKVSEIQWKY
jgi:hypothetical protein